jgi:hypothetical protein
LAATADVEHGDVAHLHRRDPQLPLHVDSSRPLRADIVEKAVKYFGDGCSREFDGAELILIAPQLCARRPNLSF